LKTFSKNSLTICFSYLYKLIIYSPIHHNRMFINIVFCCNIFLYLPSIAHSFWFINTFESTYGSWRLLYTDSSKVYQETPSCLLTILPSLELDKATVQITWRSSAHGLVVEKSSLSVVKCTGNADTSGTVNFFKVSNFNLTSYTGDFTILSSQKTVRSIWFFGLPPYVNRRYASSLPTNLRIRWKTDDILKRLYIRYGNYVYIFDRCNIDTSTENHVLKEQTTQVIALNVFLITQLLSYIFEKLANGIFYDILHF